MVISGGHGLTPTGYEARTLDQVIAALMFPVGHYVNDPEFMLDIQGVPLPDENDVDL